ncbi:Serine/threonine-protein kinase PknB [Rubripirellula lacrimiformis]|uniref:Serine/threonine-protein kinase PknB n=1 Tax=Rubripirellula lacrimiformis TaxID=1930273 RepID=A0A517NFM3_9BACT|nr:serine/threonine protein kinase [Rubripirellula lacrimiformis]QDT05936.1 Serine/threonine-protein kinase PknB [Rubripirellula lacrimiformis]
MDASRYARIRELFFAIEEMPPDAQADFLRAQAGDDQELYDEIMSLLDEHDSECARIEGESAIAVSVPPMQPDLDEHDSPPGSGSSIGTHPGTESPPKGDTTRRGDSQNRTQTDADQRVGGGSAAITKHGAHRTHASPRVKQTNAAKQSSSNNQIWAKRTRNSRRRNSGWLWLAALLPTALIGWWTYRQVESMIIRSIATELKGVVDSMTLSADQFLGEKETLVESWSREPSLRSAIVELNQLAESNPPLDKLKNAKQIDQIRTQLRELSGVEDIKFVVWNDSFRTLASSIQDRRDIGKPVRPADAAYLARVMAGETVTYGPTRLTDEPGTEKPIMAVIVPIHDDSGRIIASMLVRGIGIFEEFNRIFTSIAVAGELDAYAINREGTMITESPRAISKATQGRFDLAPDQIAANLRVSDPGFLITGENAADLQRQVRPVTVAVAGAIASQPDVRTDPYMNYCGESVVGAWQWLPNRQMGVIIETTTDRAFAPARVVRFNFLLLGSLLSLTAFLAATKIARTSTAEHAAVHPLSRYDIQEQLGSGGMGVVFRANHRQLGRDAALKVLRGDRHSPEDQLRFDREARLAASLSNPHSVQIYDYGRSDQGEAYCVMEFLRGLTLQEVVARSGHQPVGRTLSILRQVCDALAEAHSMNLLHRDIKPQNVMLSLDPSVGDWAVIFDFGLAKPLEPDTSVYQTRETIWAGTPMYMAPERFRQPGVMDPRSDIYSVGCIAYYLLSGRPPFIESEPESLFALILSEHPIGIAIHRGEGIPTEVNDLIIKCMAKRPEDRYDSIVDVGRAIDQLRVKHPWTVDEARVWWGHHGGK